MQFSQGKRWFSWTRLAGVAVTVTLLYVISRQVDRAALAATFRRTQWLWFAGALGLYGLALWLGGLRWHLALRLTERNVHLGASCRLLLIGHFFYVALFGAAGGDVAKSMLYARWFRFSLPAVIAAAPLDRGLGTIGSLLVVTGTLCFAWATGGFRHLQDVDWQWSGRWWLVLVAIITLVSVTLLFWRPRGESPWSRALKAMQDGAARLFQAPHLAAKGLNVALLHQLATNAVFALCLAGVATQPLAWPHLAWTVPGVTILSCFPITVAGAGVREVASVTLLGLYGVPASDAVAAALLTLLTKLVWAGWGGLVFWREVARQAKHHEPDLAKSISIVIPTFNEASALPQTLRRLADIPEIRETIVADGGSTDDTRALAERMGCRVFSGPAGRGAQMRWGARHATGDVVMLLHADTWLPPGAGRAVLDCLRDPVVVGGGFWKTFRDSPWLLLGSRFKCAVRLWLWKRFAGDQAIFVRRHVLEELGGVPDMPLMEEFALCDRLKERGRLALAGSTIQTSARRFRAHGPLRTYLLMGWIHLLYRLNVPPVELKRMYEQGQLRLPRRHR